jgi:hypothetical protein
VLTYLATVLQQPRWPPIITPKKDYEPEFVDAVAQFWKIREAQGGRQGGEEGDKDRGSRGEVTGGLHLHPVQELIRRVLHDAGVPPGAVATGKGQPTVIPGWYRKSKNIDLVVRDADRIVLVVEIKSQVGSYSRNFNNRIEEAMGQALDYRAAVSKHLGGYSAWFGYVMVLCEDHESTRPGPELPDISPPADALFDLASYAKRYTLAFRRLADETMINSAVIALTPPNSAKVTYPDATMTFQQFAHALHQRVSAYRAEVPGAWADTPFG